MHARWELSGPVLNIDRVGTLYFLDILQEKRKAGKIESKMTVRLVSYVKPKCHTGDIILADGTFEPSYNKNWPYTLIIKHLGIMSNGPIDDVIKGGNKNGR